MAKWKQVEVEDKDRNPENWLSPKEFIEKHDLGMDGFKAINVDED